MVLQVSQNKNVNPSQVRVQEDGQIWRHIVVKLKGDQKIYEVRESTDIWQAIQHEGSLRVRRGDIVSLISADGNEICDSMRVVRAESGNVWLGSPARLVELDPVGFYSDGFSEVVAAGTGFSIANVRDGSVDERIYGTVEAAKQEIVRRRPTRAA